MPSPQASHLIRTDAAGTSPKARAALESLAASGLSMSAAHTDPRLLFGPIAR
jgi:hypothetical protein